MKLKYIDVLRGIAILGVLIVHNLLYGNNGYIPSKILNFILFGQRGVQLFYFASAFTLFFSMNRRYENETYPKTNFFIRRFFRIAPMYYIGICYYLMQDGFGSRYWLGDAKSITYGNILSNIFFVHGFNPYWINSLVPGGWSVAIEMLFYCLLPFLIFKIKNTQHAFIFVLISIFFRFLFQYILQRHHLIGNQMLWDAYLNFYFPNQLPIFALGILFYFILKEDYSLSLSPKILIPSAILLIGQLVGLIIFPEHVVFGIAFVLLGILLSKYEFKFLVNPALIYIGKISFSMYLVHNAVLYWLNSLRLVDFVVVSDTYSSLLNYAIRLIILIVCTVIISTIFYKLVELPMINIGKKLIKRLNE